MNLKDLWKSKPYWVKGGIAGLCIWFIYSIFLLFNTHLIFDALVWEIYGGLSMENLNLILSFLMFITYPILLGLAGLIVDLVKKDMPLTLKGGLISIIVIFSFIATGIIRKSMSCGDFSVPVLNPGGDTCSSGLDPIIFL